MTNRILKKSSLTALLPFLFILGMTACGGDNHSNTDDNGSGSDGNETMIGPIKTVRMHRSATHSSRKLGKTWE